jgi:hypothetical protein
MAVDTSGPVLLKCPKVLLIPAVPEAVVVVVVDDEPVVASAVVVVTDEDPAVVVVVGGTAAPPGADSAVTRRAESTPVLMTPRPHLGILVGRLPCMTLWMIRILCDSFVVLARQGLYGGTAVVFWVGALIVRLPPLESVGYATER